MANGYTAKEQIRRLLNLADNDAAADQEVDNALRFARKLMHKHGLTEAEVRADSDTMTEADVQQIATEGTKYKLMYGQSFSTHLAAWEKWLIGSMCKLVGTCSWFTCSGETTTRRDPVTGLAVLGKTGVMRGKKLQAAPYGLYGPAEDCQEVHEMVQQWTQTVVAMAKLKFAGVVMRGEGRSYAEGFCSAIHRKVEEMIAEERRNITKLEAGGELDIARLASGSADEKGIVLRDRPGALVLSNNLAIMAAKKEQAELVLQQRYGIHLSKGKSRRSKAQHHASAFNEGSSDGKRSQVQRRGRRAKLGGG